MKRADLDRAGDVSKRLGQIDLVLHRLPEIAPPYLFHIDHGKAFVLSKAVLLNALQAQARILRDELHQLGVEE